MAFDASLADRIRTVLGPWPGLSERRMFGGLAFLVHGRMFAGLIDRTLMARVGLDHYEDALALPHVRVMDFTGRPMRGYVYVDPPALVDDEALRKWVVYCAAHAAGFPERPGRGPRRKPKTRAAASGPQR